MAGLAVKYEDHLTNEIMKLAAIWPEMAKEELGRLGFKSATYLRYELLSGQELNLRKHPTDNAGHRTIRFAVNKRGTHVKIFSYPVNFFEKGRTLRSGKREAPKYILSRKLKAIVAARSSVDIADISRKTFESKLKAMGF